VSNVVLLTGLPGTGKLTVAGQLVTHAEVSPQNP
jgi:predicted kinase